MTLGVLPSSKSRSRSSQPGLFAANRNISIESVYHPGNDVTLFLGDCQELLASLPNECADLIVTSPPYNIGKEYEDKLRLSEYVAQQERIIRECVRILSPKGSICWQVGNFVDKGAIIPLDTILYPAFANAGLRMRNRIIWHFEHGLHCSRRFSGRYETIVWFTKTDDYVFNLNPVRIPQKYPGKKYFKGPRAGQYSCNPLGKNPGDLWVIPNVKHNHVEKTDHPCQYPVELVERLVLSMTNESSLVVDPFMGTGTTAIGAFRHKRRAAGAEIVGRYLRVARERLVLEAEGRLATRPMTRPVHAPSRKEAMTKNPFCVSQEGND